LNLNEAEKRFKQSQEKQGMIVFDWLIYYLCFTVVNIHLKPKEVI
jgi:hypothetical protein